jgi:two-component system nitrogen regulation response regulator GlnG/two-component system response regulator HydG
MIQVAGPLDSTTVSQNEGRADARDQGGHRAAPTAALAVAFCAGEPARTGEVIVLPAGDPGRWSVLGRGPTRPDDPHPRLQLVRSRPGQILAGAPLENPRVSRVQLRVRARGSDGIEIERLGRLPLLHNGEAVDSAVLRIGDTLQIGRELLLLAVLRPPFAAQAERGGGAQSFPFGAADSWGLIGESAALWALRDRIAFAGPRSEHVLITGQSGTGKELVARALHAIAAPGRPLVARNAATFPEGLIDAELFGNVRNYPNAGAPDRPGLIGEANGSTLFLDEFAELPAAMQAHLLRVLDAGEYQRLGDSQTRRSRFRLIAATNRPLGSIKHDVLARLPLRIEVPGLEARREDIPLIARHLLARLAGATPVPSLSLAFVAALVRHPFAAHVRELETLLLEALPRGAGGAELEPPPVLPVWPTGASAPPPDADAEAAAAPSLSPERVQECLDLHGGRIEPVWRALGLANRHVLLRLIARHGLRAGRTWRPRAE